MEVQAINNIHSTAPLINPKPRSPSKEPLSARVENVTSRSNSPSSTTSELEKDLNELSINNSLNSLTGGGGSKCKSNGSISGVSSSNASTTGEGAILTPTSSSAAKISNGNCVGDGDSGIENGTQKNGVEDGNGAVNPTATVAGTTTTTTTTATIPTPAATTYSKRRLTSSRTPTRKARRVKFYRNGDRFYPGITIPVSNERYRSFESLFEDLTRLLEDNVKIPGAVRTIYTMCGKKIGNLDELEDGQCYVCSCNNEGFKKIEYNATSQPLANLNFSIKPNNRLTINVRPSSPLKNGGAGGGVGATTGVNGANGTGGGATGAGLAGAAVGGGAAATNGTSIVTILSERDSVVHPRIVSLIRSGTKPRKIMRLLLNKRNSPTFDHVLTAITQVVKLDSGCVRKVYTLSGGAVTQLADFFATDDVFFAYGTERVNNPDDFRLEPEEQRAIQAISKTMRTAGSACKGPKPKMPVKKCKNIRSTKCIDTSVVEPSSEEFESGIDPTSLPASIRDRYALDQMIGDGNFAVVLKVMDRETSTPYALKIIDKSKCRGKEYYIEAEVRVMKKLHHPNIISLVVDVDQTDYMYLVLELVNGGDLFDAITRVTRFSEDQARIMIRHLAAAMAYLHSLRIVHRDIKPENLLVELDESGGVVQLKLADFGLACEVTEPLFAVCGTPTYVAPEILLETGYGLKIDVWAAGVILYIMLCGFPPFVAPDNRQEPLFDAIISGVYEFPDPYWSDVGDDVRDLIANMLQSDPDVRFTSEDILDHYWTMSEYSDFN